MWPSSPRHKTTAPAFPNPTRIPNKTNAIRDLWDDNLLKSLILIYSRKLSRRIGDVVNHIKA